MRNLFREKVGRIIGRVRERSPEARLNFHKFRVQRRLKPHVSLGEGVKLVFDTNCKMKLTCASKQVGTGISVLTIHGIDREPNDWLGLDISVASTTRFVDITLRYAPAERIFPRVHYRNVAAGSDAIQVLDLPDRAAPDGMAIMRFDVASWSEQIASKTELSDMTLSLLLPARPWFALQIQDINEVSNA